MGTKIYRESYLPEYQYQSARNNNEKANNSNWQLFFGNKTIQNGQYCNGILVGSFTNFLSGYEKDALKQMMLSHEAAFKHQVSELHRLYKVQKEIMNDIKRKELYKQRMLIETPPSSSSLVHIATYGDALKTWQKSLIPKIDSLDYEILESRPSKARKRLFDLHLPADKYIDIEEEKAVVEDKRIDLLNNSSVRTEKADPEIGASLDSKIQFFDLNEPLPNDDVDVILTPNILQKSKNGKENMIYMNVAGYTEPHLGSNFGIKTTFSKLLSDEILKASISCKNKEINDIIGSSCDPTSSHNKFGNRIGSIDINLVCEVGAEVEAEENEKRDAEFGDHIDLNMCATEDDITLVTSCASATIDVKITLDKDVEIPALADPKNDTSSMHIAEKPQDESDTLAATALVAISSVEETSEDPSEGSLEEALLWFSEAISKSDLENVPNEIDDFEAMTLMLTELKEDEYMPKPLVVENMELETEVITLPIRARRGKIKRQKRDFQREILPGMISLSRLEVAEDVQTFNGIMKAMGSSWSAMAKRNGSAGRGRRRLVAEMAPLVEPKVICKPLIERINSVEIGLEDRVLAEWGKTPRRPRRRRCHAGNLSSITSS